ncbi:MAG: diguanylate cyclase [Solirubrobacteraceae bacterium]
MLTSPTRPDGERPRVVIADDEPVVRAAISAQLRSQFDVVGQADDADGAIRLAQSCRPDVALIDVEMPGGGLYATQVIRVQSPDTAIVILSSDRTRASVLEFLDAGATAYLRKGSSPKHLAERINEALSARRLTNEPADRIRRAADERFRAAFDEAGVRMAIMPLEGDRAGRLIAVNSAYATMLGRDVDELIGANAESWTHPDDLPDGLGDPFSELAAGLVERAEFETRFIHRDGSIVWVSVTAASFCDEDGERAAVVQVIDVSERKRFEARLQHQAEHDPLTGLFNRRRLDEELEHALARARRYGSRRALLLLDLDGFKFVNDSLGHGAGDELVVRLADTIRGALREVDVVARTGGDEFAVLLPETDEQQALLVARRLLEAIRRQGTILRAGVRAQVTTSIGITTFDGREPTTAEDLLVEADIARAGSRDCATQSRRSD